jgi:hypothetical protein
MSASPDKLACRRLLQGIDMPDHWRDQAVHSLQRAEAFATCIAALVRLPRTWLNAYRRDAARPHPHPSHE